MGNINCSVLPSSSELLEVIQTLTEVVYQGLDIAWVMEKVVERSQEIVNATGAVVEILDKTTDEMVYRAVAGSAVGMLGLRLNRATSLSGLCVATASVLYCEDSETDPRVDRQACRKVGLRSMICVPLIYKTEAVGALKVISSNPHSFTQSDICIMELMSQFISASMHNATKFGEDELFKQATTDSLTGLANRLLFFDRLNLIIGQANRRRGMLVVLVIDMDGLKSINDQEGHQIGDLAIREIANRVRIATRQQDTVARLGGDEFAVILPEVERLEDATLIIKRIAESCDQPFVFEGKKLAIGSSIGAAVYPVDGESADLLLSKADSLMYEAKRIRKGLSCPLTTSWY